MADGGDDNTNAGCGDGPGLFFSIAPLLLLFLLIMGLAGSVDTATLKAQFHRKLGICCGLGCQFVLMPFIGFILVELVGPEDHVGLTMMILCSSSGGAYSNWWCSLFNADLALSVAMTAVSTLVSAAMLPLNLTVYMGLLGKAEHIEVPWTVLLEGVGTVCAAIITGVCLTTRFPKHRGWMNIIGNASGVCMIGLTAVVSMLPKRKDQQEAEEVTPPWAKEASFYLFVASPFFASLLTSLLISSLRCLRLRRPERVAITIEVSYQNVGIASAVALAAFCQDPRKRSDAAAVPLIYGLIEASALAGFCLIAWKAGWTYAPREANVCEILRGDYQPASPVEGAPAEATPAAGTDQEANEVIEDVDARSFASGDVSAADKMPAAVVGRAVAGMRGST